MGDGPPPKLIFRGEPGNLEFPFEGLQDVITPTEHFFVRNHFPVPELEEASWRLKLEGLLKTPLTLSLKELTSLPSETVTVTLECAGNGRSFLSPAAKGVQWALGAVGTATWTGVPLRALLEQAGLEEFASQVVFVGADTGEVSAAPKPDGPLPYSRGLPLAKALEDVLLAYRMNDRPLTFAHGFPLRALVPGHYGMASVKWLTRVLVTDAPSQGYFETVDYARWQLENGLPRRVPLGEMPVKSQIARPGPSTRIPAGSVYRVFGAAWSGAGEVTEVGLYCDGQVLGRARLLGEPLRNAWRLWDYAWQVPEPPGQYTLAARATDATGRSQPLGRDQDLETYMISHVLPVTVTVV